MLRGWLVYLLRPSPLAEGRELKLLRGWLVYLLVAVAPRGGA